MGVMALWVMLGCGGQVDDPSTDTQGVTTWTPDGYGALPAIAGLSQSPSRYSRAYAAAAIARLDPAATPAGLRAASAAYRCPLTTPQSRW